MGYPKECNLCVVQEINPELVNEELNLSVRPFQQGKKPHIMLVGLNPTLQMGKAQTVLQLDDKKSPNKHASKDILQVVNLDQIYATNLVKCTFSKEPRVLCKYLYDKNDNKTVKQFLSPFFHNCKKYFSEELNEISLTILISFGEIPHQLIVEGFGLIGQNVDKEMKKAFSNIYRINLLGRDTFYVPCIRERANTQAFLHDSWPVFIKRLKATVNSVMI